MVIADIPIAEILAVIMVAVPPLANLAIALLRHFDMHGWADWVTVKAPLVLQVLASNKPKEEAIKVIVGEVAKMIDDPAFPLHPESPVSVAAKELEASK